MPPLSLDDYVQPVLVKEVRQSMRGKLFNSAFLVALGLAVVLAFAALLEARETGNYQVVSPLAFVLVAALLVYLPFHALQSMRQEESSGARDLMLLTPLGPWRLVIGKLLSALVVGLLILAAFAPFLTVSSLLPGVDIRQLMAYVAHIMGVSVLLVAFGVAAGAAQTNRASRGATTALLGVLLFGVMMMEMQILAGIQRGAIDEIAIMIGLAWGWGAGLAPLVLGFAACAVARDDREVSTGLRRAWFFVVVVSALVVAILLPLTDAPGDVVAGFSMFVPLVGIVAAGFVCSEEERIDGDARRRIRGRRTAVGRMAAVLTTCGGGRGAALTLVLGLIATTGGVVGYYMIEVAGRGHSNLDLPALLFVMFAAVGTALAFALTPSRLEIGGKGPRGRRIQRWTTAISLVVLSIVLPVVLLIFSQGGVDPEAMFFSPLFVFGQAVDGTSDSIAEVIDDTDGTILLWVGVALAGYAMAIPAALRSVGAAWRA